MPDSNLYDERIMQAVDQAQQVMAAHMAALNARDEPGLNATLHFPHHRLSGGLLKTWAGPGEYLRDFQGRTTDDWHHSAWDKLDVVAASSDKVHLNVQFTRYREDDSVIGIFRSMWVISLLAGRWAAQLRSSFAA